METMDETRYMISDAAKKVEVEAHVLRYWEEELELPIARTELGHRYYTDEDIRVFQNIKELKERGFQLKAIKVLLPEIAKKEIKNTDNIIHIEEKLNKKALEKEPERPESKAETFPREEVAEDENTPQKAKKAQAARQPESKAPKSCDAKAEECESDVLETALAELEVNVDRLVQFEKIVGNIVTTALKENNKELNEQISDNVSKEIDLLMKLREEREEERYRRLDETIRAHQQYNSYVAAAKADDVKAEKKKFFFWRR